MSDVTFGVKVSEEMKNELSQLMKEHALSGKEFMSMLIASYKLDQAKAEAQLFESDLAELQQLIRRISGIFINMAEKSQLSYKEEQEALERVIQDQQSEKEKIIEEQLALKETLKEIKEREKVAQNKLQEKEKEVSVVSKELEVQKTQLKNNLLLHQKFQEEVTRYKEQIKGYQRLEVEISERNEENTKLKNRMDEMASETWFLQREIEKLQKEKEQLQERHATERQHLQAQFDLRLKNELLEQKIQLSEQVAQLKEEALALKEEKTQLIQDYEAQILKISVEKK